MQASLDSQNESHQKSDTDDESSLSSSSVQSTYQTIRLLEEGRRPKRKKDVQVVKIPTRLRHIRPKIENEIKKDLNLLKPTLTYSPSIASVDTSPQIIQKEHQLDEPYNTEYDNQWLKDLNTLIESTSQVEDPLQSLVQLKSSLTKDPDESTQHLICEILLDYLSNIHEFFKRKQTHFIHQLAQTQTVVQKLSRDILKRVFHYYNEDLHEFKVNISSELFMRCLLNKAQLDALKFNDARILYEVVNERDECMETPLMIATKLNRHSMVQLLLSYQANPNLINSNKHTTLHLACLRGSYETFKILVQDFYLKLNYFSTINQIDSEGNSALALAIINHKRKIITSDKSLSEIDNLNAIRDLIHVGADLNMVNADQDTLLHLICKNNNDTSSQSYQMKVELLRLFKPSFEQLTHVKNMYGCTPVDCWSGFKLFRTAYGLFEAINS